MTWQLSCRFGNLLDVTAAFAQAMRRDPDSTACARGLKRCRALVSAKEQGNTAFKERRWGDAHRHYSDAIARFAPGCGNEAFFAQCFSNRCALVLHIVLCRTVMLTLT